MEFLGKSLVVIGATGLLTGLGGKYFFYFPVMNNWTNNQGWGDSAWSLPVGGMSETASYVENLQQYLYIAFDRPMVAVGSGFTPDKGLGVATSIVKFGWADSHSPVGYACAGAILLGTVLWVREML
jgi:hypothetical protein